MAWRANARASRFPVRISGYYRLLINKDRATFLCGELSPSGPVGQSAALSRPFPTLNSLVASDSTI